MGNPTIARQLTFPLSADPVLAQHPAEPHGVVYTKPWVVNLILDLAGYTAEHDLAHTVAVEPAAGDGAFLVAMVRRLVASCHRHAQPIESMAPALMAYELDPTSAARARQAITTTLVELGIGLEQAETLTTGWVRTGDYLVDAPTLPPADFVIGNPPYIRLEDLGDQVAAAYRAAYPTMRGRADIYIAFLEAALRQLAPQGVCAFVCADRWMFNQYGAGLRQLVTSQFSVEAVIEMHQADAFADTVSAYPAITVLRRGSQGAAVVAQADQQAAAAGDGVLATAIRRIHGDTRADGHALPAGLRATRVTSWFQGSDLWPCVDPAKLALLRELEARFFPLESIETGTKVGIGVATGADAVFLTTDPNRVERSRLLPLALAGDTVTGELRWSGNYLINPWTDTGLVDLGQFPHPAAYLRRHEPTLRQRHVGRKNPEAWFRTIDRVNTALTGTPKLYIPDIKDRLNPVLDRGETYPHHNLYVIQSTGWDLEVLGGLLLSAIGQFFVACYGVRMRGGYFRFQAQYLRRIRVPHPETITPSQAAALRDAFRQRDRALATRVASAVYQLDSCALEELLV